MFKKGDLFDTPFGVMVFDHIDADGYFWFKRDQHNHCFDAESVFPHKQETPKKLRDVPHAEVMYRWLTELDLIVQFSVLGDIWIDASSPTWDSEVMYRIKPATVTKYQWVVGSPSSTVWITESFYKDEKELTDTLVEGGYTWIQRLDQTAKKFEVTIP